jgi:hypothetical protein
MLPVAAGMLRTSMDIGRRSRRLEKAFNTPGEEEKETEMPEDILQTILA